MARSAGHRAGECNGRVFRPRSAGIFAVGSLVGLSQRASAADLHVKAPVYKALVVTPGAAVLRASRLIEL